MVNLPREIIDKLDKLPSSDAVTSGLYEPSNHFDSDQTVADLLRYHIQAGTKERKAIANRLSKNREFLLIVAVRMAAMAIRTNDPTYLFLGIIALVVENLQTDSRDTIVHLSLLKYASMKIDASIAPFFDRAREFASPEFDELLHLVSKRRITRSSIKKMGFDETSSEHGFLFQVVPW